MAPQTINVLLTTFPGLGLPRTLNLQVSFSAKVADVEQLISNRLPENITNLVLTTTSNKLLSLHSSEPVTNLLSSEEDGFLPLRLSAKLCGGKGGFGSQLRAAGGRMASRKKKNQGEQHASSRTLDGRRIRTVNEAKALAEYLAIKPEMDRHERDERRKRLEEIVRHTEARKAEILNGSKGKLDGDWLESKEEAAEKAREAVMAALRAGDIKSVFGEQNESDTSGSGSEEDDGSESDEAAQKKTTISVPKSKDATKPDQTQAAPRKFFGWDEDDISEESEDDQDDTKGDTSAETTRV